MPLIPRLASFFRNLTRKANLERDLSEEVGAYLDLLTRVKMKEGLSESEARRAAAIELGGSEQLKEQVRDVRLGHFLETRWQDLRFAFRSLRKSPVFSCTVVIVLALGIGSTGLMFTIVNSVLIEGPPFPRADQLFMLWGKIPQESQVSFSPKEFSAWRKQTQLFESLAAYTGNGFTVSGRGEPELVTGQLITPNLLPALRVAPALGRIFLATEAQPGRDHVVILSDGFWRTKFGARPDVIGLTINLNGEPYSVVGVMPAGFYFPTPEVKIWAPMDFDDPFFLQHPDAHFLRAIGRVKTGVSEAQLQAETDVIGKRISDPADDSNRQFYEVRLQEQMNGELRTPLLVLLGAVALLLAIACANVANLMLARGKARAAELAVRAALGASRWRLIAQLLTESILLAAIGGAAGFAIATWSLDLLRHFALENIPQLIEARIDTAVLLFVVAVSALCGAVFGVGPACQASTTNFAAAFAGANRATAHAARSRNLLVFAEIALAAVLLVGCALMLRSFVRLAGTDPGFQPEGVVTANAVPSAERYRPEQLLPFCRETLARLETLPGVDVAGVVTHLPFGGNDWGNGFEIAGRPGLANDSARIRGISPGYLPALRLPLLQGRNFTARDVAGAPGVALVSEQFARHYWPNDNPIGQKLRYQGDWLLVVGVCGDVKHQRLDETPDRTIYVPCAQMAPAVLDIVGRDLHFVVRSSQPGSVAADLRTTLQNLDPEMVVKINRMDALIHDSLGQPRFRTWLIVIFSSFALALAALGIYGVIAYLVTQRYKEIGIRLALGATRRNILQLILGGTLKLAAAGTVVGLCVAFFLARFLTAILFGVTAHDPVSFALVPMGLIAIALLAGYLPARRATRVDPVTSLRCE